MDENVIQIDWEKCDRLFFKVDNSESTEILKITPDHEIYYRGKFYKKDKELALMLLDISYRLTRKL